MVQKALVGCHIVTLGRWSAEYSQDSLKKWIEHQSGHHQVKINAKTTHLVVTEDKFREDHKLVQEARELIKSGSRIDIVKYEWLEAVFRGPGRRSVTKYLWEDSNKKVSRPKAPGKNSELLQAVGDHVKHVTNDKEMEKAVQKRVQISEAAEAAEASNRADKADWLKHAEPVKHAENPDVTQVFGLGAKRAKDDHLSSNYHIFVDSTGFAYDVTMTKIEFESNRNERWAVTVYESNTVPHSYAVNAKFSGTATLPRNSVIVSIGSTFEAAFRRFRGFFEAKTHVAWEDRILFARERDRLELARSEGRSVSTHSREKFREVNRDIAGFEGTPYHYYLPEYGPIGLADIKMSSPADIAKKNAQGPGGSRHRD